MNEIELLLAHFIRRYEEGVGFLNGCKRIEAVRETDEATIKAAIDLAKTDGWKFGYFLIKEEEKRFGAKERYLIWAEVEK